tara:strand:- start:286 stop:531 length:246 start_codon:yes stop_codon:yes gene_type:complete
MIKEYLGPKEYFECEMCGTKKVQGKYKYKPYQYVPDYEPTELITCKACIYKEVYGSKKKAKMMKLNIIEEETLGRVHSNQE